MSKTPIDYSKINAQSLSYLKDFVSARIAIAKEDQRHKKEMKWMKEKLESIRENRDNDIKTECH